MKPIDIIVCFVGALALVSLFERIEEWKEQKRNTALFFDSYIESVGRDGKVPGSDVLADPDVRRVMRRLYCASLREKGKKREWINESCAKVDYIR